MSALQKWLNTPVRFIAALHDDHTDIRHVHIIALVNRSLTLRDFQALRMAATNAALGQRKLLDQTLRLAMAKTRQATVKDHGVVTPRYVSHRGLPAPQTIKVQDEAPPPCPKAGMGEHPVATITPGLYWCRTCHEAIRDTQFTRSSQQRGQELTISL
jgi:hypothetical protein